MITKRARRWLRRGFAAAVIAVVILVAGTTFIYTEVIEDELLTMAATPPDRDPADVNVIFEDIKITGPLGPLPAWYSSGVDDTWVLLVHGHTGSRSDTLGALPVAKRLGFPVLVVTYRNDPGAPASPSERFGLGQSEWPDLEAAVEYAIAGGAKDVVLAGFGSGASVVAAFVHNSDWAGRVRALVFDSPLLEAGAVIDRRARSENVPGFVSEWAKSMATLRFGIDWAKIDQIRRAEEFEIPILLLHGTDDEYAPVESSDAFAEALPGIVDYERFPGGGHVTVWESDPDRYEAVLRSFLSDVAVGPSDLDPVDPLELLE